MTPAGILPFSSLFEIIFIQYSENFFWKATFAGQKIFALPPFPHFYALFVGGQ
jgi:hypothetical protein